MTCTFSVHKCTVSVRKMCPFSCLRQKKRKQEKEKKKNGKYGMCE